MAKRWYVVHAYSGFEKNVARALKERIGLSKLEEYFGQVLVPTEEVVEMRAGQKRRSERKFFPGYVLVEMELNDETWHLVKETPRVMGFIGGKADRPAPLTENEAKAILDRVESGGDKATPKTIYEPGELVRVTDGPFNDFNGVVESVNYEKSRLVVGSHDLRSLHAGGTRLRAGREGLIVARERDGDESDGRGTAAVTGSANRVSRRTFGPIQGEIDGKESPGLHPAAGAGR